MPYTAEQTLYRWKKRFLGMEVAEESRNLRQLVADLSLNKQMP